jgi:hypothetical protein
LFGFPVIPVAANAASCHSDTTHFICIQFNYGYKDANEKGKVATFGLAFRIWVLISEIILTVNLAPASAALVPIRNFALRSRGSAHL